MKRDAAIALWYLTIKFGVRGAAMTWAELAAVDFLLLAYAADCAIPQAGTAHSHLPLHQGVIAGVALIGFGLVGTSFCDEFLLKFAVIGIILALFVFWVWSFVLDAADRSSLINTARQARLSLRGSDK